jgi:hypothetical protein
LQRTSRKLLHLFASIVAVTLFQTTANASDESMATLADGQGPVEISKDGEVVGTVRAGEHFLVKPELNYWNVYRKSGFDGYIDKVHLHLLPDEPLMKLNYAGQKKSWQKWQSAPDSKMGDTASSAKSHGVNYFKTLIQASDGNMKAMARFFSLSPFMDGAAAEGYYPHQWILLHVAGDETFAKFLRRQSVTLREQIGGTFTTPDDTDPISKPKPYLKQYFPKTYQILFGKE